MKTAIRRRTATSIFTPLSRRSKRNGFTGYVRPDHGRNIWGEEGKPGYGLYDRALGAAYLSGLFEAVRKDRA